MAILIFGHTEGEGTAEFIGAAQSNGDTYTVRSLNSGTFDGSSHVYGYIRSDASTSVYLNAVTLSGDTVNFGVPSGIIIPGNVELSTSRIGIYLRNSTNGVITCSNPSTDIYATPFTYSGNTITSVGTPINILTGTDNPSTSFGGYHSIARINNDKFMVQYFGNGIVANSTYVQQVQFDTNTLLSTVGTSKILDDFAFDTGHHLAPVDDDKLLSIFTNPSVLDHFEAEILTVSGSTVTEQSVNGLNFTSGRRYHYPVFEKISTTEVMLAYTDAPSALTANDDQVKVLIYQISGNNNNDGNQRLLEVDITGYARHPRLTVLSSTDAILTYNAITDGSNPTRVYHIDISSTFPQTPSLVKQDSTTVTTNADNYERHGLTRISNTKALWLHGTPSGIDAHVITI